MIHVTDDVNFKYFYYKGQSYTTGTEVKLKQSYIETHKQDGKNIWPYAVFSHRGIRSNPSVYVLWVSKYEWNNPEMLKCATTVCIKIEDMEGAIEEIIEPVPIELVPAVPKKDWEVEGMGVLWLIYIAVLFFSLIFRDFYVIWICATYGFFKIRKGLLNE